MRYQFELDDTQQTDYRSFQQYTYKTLSPVYYVDKLKANNKIILTHLSKLIFSLSIFLFRYGLSLLGNGYLIVDKYEKV